MDLSPAKIVRPESTDKQIKALLAATLKAKGKVPVAGTPGIERIVRYFESITNDVVEAVLEKKKYTLDIL